MVDVQRKLVQVDIHYYIMHLSLSQIVQNLD